MEMGATLHTGGVGVVVGARSVPRREAEAQRIWIVTRRGVAVKFGHHAAFRPTIKRVRRSIQPITVVDQTSGRLHTYLVHPSDDIECKHGPHAHGYRLPYPALVTQ